MADSVIAVAGILVTVIGLAGAAVAGASLGGARRPAPAPVRSDRDRPRKPGDKK